MWFFTLTIKTTCGVSRLLPEEIKKMSIAEIQGNFKAFLDKQDIAQKTRNTRLTASFYLYRYYKDGEKFLEILLSPHFESIAKDSLEEANNKLSTRPSEKDVLSYMSHLRKLREYLLGMDEVQFYKKAEGQPRRKGSAISTRDDIPAPSVNEVDKYLALWKRLENYSAQEAALDKLFHKMCPNNTSIEDILLKVAALNDFYSTNIFSIYSVAQHILSLNIDDRLSSGDKTLVKDIMSVETQNKKINFYSFATKYCSHHKDMEFPIYDSYVDTVLRYFRDVYGFSSFHNKELKDYLKFNDIIKDFQQHFGLEKYTVKEIDRYLWQLGKEMFPNPHFNKK